jgi:chromosome partitioning protein
MQKSARCIAFHSYKGGTGKTTIAANLSALLASKGYKVALLDLDVYAPSLHTYFEKTPKKWINDLFLDDAKVDDIMLDVTSEIVKGSADSKGKLWLAFSNPDKEAIYRLEGSAGKQSSPKLHTLRKFIELREHLISGYQCDYILIDTSPGVRFWSINSLAISDILLLTLKFGELDIVGTKKIANEIYSSFTELGAKSFLLLNRVAGYCIPHAHEQMHQTAEPKYDESDFEKKFSNEAGLSVVTSIPCYCDIQFLRKEFLTVLHYPEHPFAKKLERLTESEQIKG